MSRLNEKPLMDSPKRDVTATNKQIDPSTGSDASTSAAAGGVSRNASMNSADKRRHFRERIGIKETGDLPARYLFRNRIEKAYRDQTRFYYLAAGASHGLLWLQIGIGATLTALGSQNNREARIAITTLGAINTVVAGMLTFLKSRNQPNRALQFRNGLRGVYEDLWQIDAEMSCGDDYEKIDPDAKVDELWKRYKEVRQEAEANYPDLWVSLNKLTMSHNKDKNPSTQLDDVSVSDEKEGAHQVSEGLEPLLVKNRP